MRNRCDGRRKYWVTSISCTAAITTSTITAEALTHKSEIVSWLLRFPQSLSHCCPVSSMEKSENSHKCYISCVQKLKRERKVLETEVNVRLIWKYSRHKPIVFLLCTELELSVELKLQWCLFLMKTECTFNIYSSPTSRPKQVGILAT